MCCISHYVAYNLCEREIIMIEDNSSYGGGFALGFLLGVIGVIIALAVGISGSKIRRGAGHGFLASIIIGCLFGILLFAMSFSTIVY